MELLIETLRFIAPVYVANPVPVLLGGGKPVDLGHTLWDGKRIFGDGKTWRGLIAGITAGTIVGFLQGRLLPGFLLGLGAMCGDLFGSFVKRRLGVARGSPAPGIDQLDFLVGALLLVSLVEPPTLGVVLTSMGLTLVLHPLTNLFAWLLHLKPVPW